MGCPSRTAALIRINTAISAQRRMVATPSPGRPLASRRFDECGHTMLAKALTLFAGADAAGLVLGARVPIVLTSRADNLRARMASCAVPLLYARARTMSRGSLPMGH